MNVVCDLCFLSIYLGYILDLAGSQNTLWPHSYFSPNPSLSFTASHSFF